MTNPVTSVPPQLASKFDFSQVKWQSDLLQVLSVSRHKTCFEFPLTQPPINFSVLWEDGQTSQRWGITTSTKGDAYIYCRDGGEYEKVSLHVSGTQHISVTADTALKAGQENRIALEWQEPYDLAEAIATFRLFFPPWTAKIDRTNVSFTKDELLIVGNKEKMVVVSFVILDSSKTMSVKQPHFLFGRVPLNASRDLHILAHKEPHQDLLDSVRNIFPCATHLLSELAVEDGDYLMTVKGFRGPNSAYLVPVSANYTPSKIK